MPRRAEGPGGLIGDGMVEIGPDDPEYAEWLAWIEGDEWRVLTWQEALRRILDSGPTDQMVADFMASEETRFRRFPDERREAEQMIAAARPAWVRALYQRTVEALVSEGKKPTDARVAERIGDGMTDRTVRRWRHDGLL